MTSNESVSILEGPKLSLYNNKEECVACHRVFEKTLLSLEKLNNNEAITSFHDINLKPGVPVIYYHENSIPLTEINEEANQFARAIKKNFKKVSNSDGDTVVAIHLSHSPQLISALLAIWKLGAAYLPLETNFPDHRIHFILEETKPCLVLVDEDNPDRYRNTPFITLKELKALSTGLVAVNIVCPCWGKDLSIKVIEIERIAAIIYTSGSTGLPKGVRLSHRAVINRMKWIWKTFPYSDTENTLLFKKALTFVDSMVEIWAPLLSGKSLVVLSNDEVVDAKTFTDICERYKIERVILSPALLRKLVQYIKSAEDANGNKNIMPHLKLCVSSADVLRLDVAKMFFECFQEEQTKLVNIYGSTEVNGDVLYHEVHKVNELTSADYIASGIPLANTTVYILDEEQKPVKLGEIGETYASGCMVGSGYVGRNESEKYLPNSFSSDPKHGILCRIGDYGRIEKGVVYFEGRRDAQIKVLGFRVNMSEVDHAVANVDGVEKFEVLCYMPREPNQALLAFVTGKSPDLQAKVQHEIATVLPPYMVPTVLAISEIPLLSSNKVDRVKLLSHYETHVKQGTVASIDPFTTLPL